MVDIVNDFMVSRKKLSIVYSKDYYMGVVDCEDKCLNMKFRGSFDG
jgi:hypothetical protein